MLKRHANPWLKYFVASGSLIFFAANLSGHLLDSREFLMGFLLFELAVLLAILLMLQMRRREDLSVEENSFADAVFIAAILALPLVVTDFRNDFVPSPVRLGAIGGVFFVYVCIRTAPGLQIRRNLVGELTSMLLKSAVLAITFWLINSILTTPQFIRFYALSLAFFLLITVFERLRILNVDSKNSEFEDWLLQAKTTSTESFIQSLRLLPTISDSLLIPMIRNPNLKNAVFLMIMMTFSRKRPGA
jgi:hypothetical protein